MVFGNLGNMANLFKSAREMQANFARLQEELTRRRHEADAGGGMVRAVVDGRGMPVEIKIDPAAVEDIELLEDLVKGAVVAAMTKSQEAMKEEMATITGGLNFPGLNEMLSSGGSGTS